MTLTSEQVATLEEKGWTVTAESPLHLLHTATASIATGLAAMLLAEHLTSTPVPLSPLQELRLLHLRTEALAAKGLKGDKDGNYLWSEIYDEVFSESCSRRIWALLDELSLSLDYYDPDMDYDDDVLAFTRAFDSLMRELAEKGMFS